MKIRTIVGVLLVLALVLGSTGVALAGYDDDKGKGDQVKLRDDSCLTVDITTLADQIRDRACDGDCEPIGDGPYHGPH
ncbi:MAG: hypothetical protein KAR76_04330 [Methanosarcinales archaeon]|nr:hypothetical protein [Methanosarcinales archaeon]